MLAGAGIAVRSCQYVVCVTAAVCTLCLFQPFLSMLRARWCQAESKYNIRLHCPPLTCICSWVDCGPVNL